MKLFQKLKRLNNRGTGHVELFMIAFVVVAVSVVGVRLANTSHAGVAYLDKAGCELRGRVWIGGSGNPCEKKCISAAYGTYVVSPVYDYCSNTEDPASVVNQTFCGQLGRKWLNDGCARLYTQKDTANSLQCASTAKDYYKVNYYKTASGRLHDQCLTAAPVVATPKPAPAPTPAPAPAPSVNTAPYTTLPAEPAATSTIHPAWVSWKAAIATATAQKLTGQALVNYLTTYKTAYDTAVAAAAKAGTPTPTPTPATPVFACTTSFSPLTLSTGALVRTSASVTATNPTSVAAKTYYVVFQERYSTSATTELSRVELSSATLAKGAQLAAYTKTASYTLNGSKATVSQYTSVVGPSGKLIDCANGAITWDLKTGSGKVATAPAPTPPTPSKPPVTPTPGKPGEPTPPTPSTPGRRQPAAVADLGYTATLLCVNSAKGSITYAKNCNTANAMILVVGGKQSDPTKDKLKYDVTVAKVKFANVTTCAPRYIITSGKDINADCTIMYAPQSFFASVKASINKSIKSIVSSASKDTHLTKSEANADIAKLKKAGVVSYTVSISYPKYTTQVVSGKTLDFSTNVTADVNAVNNAIDGTTTPTSKTTTPQKGSGSSSTTNTAALKKACVAAGRNWNDSKSTCVRTCARTGYVVIHNDSDQPYDKCHPKPATTADCKHYYGSNYVLKSGACVVSGTPTQADCQHYYGSNYVLKSGKCVATGASSCGKGQIYDSKDGCIPDGHGCSTNEHYTASDGCISNNMTITTCRSKGGEYHNSVCMKCANGVLTDVATGKTATFQPNDFTIRAGYSCKDGSSTGSKPIAL